MRYIGEQFSVNVPIVSCGDCWLAAAVTAFHALHDRLYGFSVADEPVEVVNVRLRAVGRLHREAGDVDKRKSDLASLAPAPMTRRSVAFGPGKDDWREVPVYARETLAPFTRFAGPAVVEQSDSTLLVPPRRTVRADTHGNLLIEAAE
jgi:N-methylhydantoinase A